MCADDRFHPFEDIGRPSYRAATLSEPTALNEADCPFCDLFSFPKTGRVILASDDVVCFFPLKPDTFAHTLIAPREHYQSLLGCPDRVSNALLRTTKRLADHYQATLGAEAFNLLLANGPAAEQSVQHLHLHFLPRFAGDEFSAWPTLPGSDVDLDELAERLRVPV